MMGNRAIAAGRLLFGILAIVAIAVQVNTNLAAGDFNPTRFFAFFTILSNLLGAGVLIASAITRRTGATPRLDWLRGAAVVYLTITFVVFIVLLSDIDVQLVVPWVDFVLHKSMPIVVALDWLVHPPRERVRADGAVWWLLPPLIWLAATLVRGAIDGWYPYPFLDPANGGYLSVAVTCAVICVGFVVTSAGVLIAGNVFARAAASHHAASQ